MRIIFLSIVCLFVFCFFTETDMYYIAIAKWCIIRVHSFILSFLSYHLGWIEFSRYLTRIFIYWFQIFILYFFIFYGTKSTVCHDKVMHHKIACIVLSTNTIFVSLPSPLLLHFCRNKLIRLLFGLLLVKDRNLTRV